MSMELDNELSCTPPELRNIANNVVNNLLPEKSKHKYEKEYTCFVKWCEVNKVQNYTENVLLAYFDIKSKTKKASTMWSDYSMLKSCISMKNNVDISQYSKLIAFLKRKSEKYTPKKSKILEYEEVIKFLNDADDNQFLAMKVILIMGFNGACRREELKNLTMKDVQINENNISVSIPKTKNNICRVFLITELEWIYLVKKYVQLRPVKLTHDRFFLTFRNGKCTVSPIGINKIGEVPKKIAEFLKLPYPELYTGHCFRRSSATQVANAGGDLLTIKKHGGWKSSAIAETYVDSCIKRKTEIAQMISNQHAVASTSSSTSQFSVEYTQNMVQVTTANVVTSKNSFPGITVISRDNSNVTVNIYGTHAEKTN